jgi:hypothetical protein
MTTAATVIESGPDDATEGETDSQGAMSLDQWIAWSGGAS